MKLLEILRPIEEKLNAPEKLSNSQVLALARDAIKTSKSLVFRLEKDLESSQKELAALYEHLDSGLDNFMTQLTNMQNTSDEYFRASSIYNLSWFCSLTFSLEAKVRIAQLLIDIVSNYNPSYTSNLWGSIAGRDYDTLQSIRFWKNGGPGNVL